MGILAQVKADKDSIEDLMPHVESTDRVFQEIQTLQKQVEQLEGMLDYQGLGVKSMEEITSELNDLQNSK